MASAAGTILAPAAPGTVAVNCGFQPVSVLFLAANMDDPGVGSPWRQETTTSGVTYDICLGMAGYGEGTTSLVNACLNWAVARDTGGQYGAPRSMFWDACVRTREDTSETDPVTMSVVSFDAGGFTVEFTETLLDRRVWWWALNSVDEFGDAENVMVSEMTTPPPSPGEDEYVLGEGGKAALVLWRGDGDVVPVDTWYTEQPIASIGAISEDNVPQEFGGVYEAAANLDQERSWGVTGSSTLVIPVTQTGPLGTLVTGWLYAIDHTYGWNIGTTRAPASDPPGFGAAWMIADDTYPIRSWAGYIGPPYGGSASFNFGDKLEFSAEFAIMFGAERLPDSTSDAWRVSIGFAHADLQVCVAISRDWADGSITQGVFSDASWVSHWDHDTPDSTATYGTATFVDNEIVIDTLQDGTILWTPPTFYTSAPSVTAVEGNFGLTQSLQDEEVDAICVAQIVYWGPLTTGNVSPIPTPAGYQSLAQIPVPTTPEYEGRIAWFWRRLTTADAQSIVCTRGSGWTYFGTPPGSPATNATVYAVRTHMIRGVTTTIDPPYDDVQVSGPHTNSNQPFPAVSVLGDNRLVMQFLASQDNQTAGAAPAGWTAGSYATTTVGSDAGFGTFYRVTSASTTADASSVGMPAQGAYAFCGVSWIPCCSADRLYSLAIGRGDDELPQIYRLVLPPGSTP